MLFLANCLIVESEGSTLLIWKIVITHDPKLVHFYSRTINQFLQDPIIFSHYILVFQETSFPPLTRVTYSAQLKFLYFITIIIITIIREGWAC
jgi:hypothetical protein